MNCSQELLAERSGISPRAIRNIENGVVARPRRATLACLARGLGLDPADVEAFVEAWYPSKRRTQRGDRDLLRRGDPIDDYLSDRHRLARTRRRFLDWSCHTLVDADRWQYRSITDMGICAEEPSLDRAVYVYHHSTDSIAWDAVVVTESRNCEIERVVTVPHLAVKIFELVLGATLERGEAYRYGLTLDLSAARTDREPPRSDRTGLGVLHAGMSATQQVSFTEPAIPGGVRYVWADKALGAERSVETLQLSRFGSASFTIPDAEVGVHELVWDWPS